ncbi:MAG: aldo/keto reductase [Planctomycetia bacterium]|nr:aldo/keto reductase [Planctomycetia bacterium]
MQDRILGNTEIKISVIGMGCWAIGGWMWGGTEEKDSISAIHAALDVGINFFDTAPMYGYGRSEEILGRALVGRPRDQVVLATKCGLICSQEDWPEGKGEFHFYATENGAGNGARSDFRVYKYLRPESIREELESSLRRLKTDYVDLYQTHWQDHTSKIAETMETLLDLKREGKIRAIGVSNIQKSELDEYFACGQVDAIQERYSLLDREIEENGLMEYAKKTGMSLLPYSPLCQGLLTGRMKEDRSFPKTDQRSKKERFSPENIRKLNRQLANLRELCEKYHVSVAQLIIAWTFHKYEKINVLCGARTVEQVKENAAAGEVILSAEDVEEIENMVKMDI